MEEKYWHSLICALCEIEYRTPHKASKFCSMKCSADRSYLKVKDWLDGNGTSEEASMKNGELRIAYKRWLKERLDYSCELCGWSEMNPSTGKVPIHVDHIDGNWKNNTRENLRVICPNCHSLTANFGSLNKNSAGSRPAHFPKNK